MKFAKLFPALLILSAFACIHAKAENPKWPKSLTIATASPGGIYLPYGRFLAKLWTEKLGIAVDAVATQGPAQNIKLLDLGGAQIGMVTMGIALQGWNGAGDWTAGKQFRNMRALFPMYDTPFQLVALRKSGITALQQINKRCIEVGPRAGTGGTYIPAIIKLLGLEADIKYGPMGDFATGLLTGKCDAVVTMTAAPNPALSRAETQEPLNFIALTPEQIDAIRKAMPELSPSTVPAKTYASLDKDYGTFGVYNFGIVRADLPDDLVYQLVKVLFENRQWLTQQLPAGLGPVPQDVDKDTFLPLHPGALRYYREIGIKISPKLVP